jgi:hypothetical protein
MDRAMILTGFSRRLLPNHPRRLPRKPDFLGIFLLLAESTPTTAALKPPVHRPLEEEIAILAVTFFSRF